MTERSQKGQGGIKREGKRRRKETVTDSNREKPVLVSCASTAEVMKWNDQPWDKSDMHSDSKLNELEPRARFSIWPQWWEIKRCLSVNQNAMIKLTVVYCLCKTCKIRLTVCQIMH